MKRFSLIVFVGMTVLCMTGTAFAQTFYLNLQKDRQAYIKQLESKGFVIPISSLPELPVVTPNDYDKSAVREAPAKPHPEMGYVKNDGEVTGAGALESREEQPGLQMIHERSRTPQGNPLDRERRREVMRRGLEIQPYHRPVEVGNRILERMGR